MRDWIKPELIIEEFELSQHVATGCAASMRQDKVVRPNSVSFTVHDDRGKNQSGSATDGPDANNYLDAAEFRSAVLTVYEGMHHIHRMTEYTLNGETYSFSTSGGSWPFSS